MARHKNSNPALSKKRPKWKEFEKIILWSKCAGRCELCNEILYKNLFTQDRVNLSQFAHIIAHSPGGARYDGTKSQAERDSIDNIILLCHGCHTTIDAFPDKYTTEVLDEIKRKHEDKIARQTEPTWENCRKIVIFTAPIAKSNIQILEKEAIAALHNSGQYPIDNSVYIKIPPYLYDEKSPTFWQDAMTLMDKQFLGNFSPLIRETDKIAIFALAPQPLLVYLGWKIGEKFNYEVFQYHRNAKNAWSWPDKDRPDNPFHIIRPTEDLTATINSTREIALSFSISFHISQRVKRQLSSNALHWDICVREPNPDFIVKAEQLVEFRKIAQDILNEISEVAGNNPIHIYMAMPVSMAVTLGMAIIPKATSTIILHDYIKSLGTDIPTITINQKL